MESPIGWALPRFLHRIESSDSAINGEKRPQWAVFRLAGPDSVFEYR
jgi:hypothetical protein